MESHDYKGQQSLLTQAIGGTAGGSGSDQSKGRSIDIGVEGNDKKVSQDKVG